VQQATLERLCTSQNCFTLDSKFYTTKM